MENKFPSILKELRQEKMLTLKQLSAKSGIPYTTLQQYEANTRKAIFPMILTLAKFFNVTCGQLLGAEEL